MRDRTTRRAQRTLAACVLLIGAPIVLLLAPLLLAVSIVGDVISRRQTMGFSRLVAMALSYLLMEWVGVVLAFILWVATGFGLFMSRPWSRRAHYGVQKRWAQSVFSSARIWLGLRVDFEDADLASGGPVIVAARHASLFDALFPTILLNQNGGLIARHVLKRELAWDPCLGLFGNRHPNHFVDRESGEKAERSAIESLAASAGDDAALVIFPEGTFPSATNPERILNRLAVRDPERSERLRLQHLLPSRPGGILALLQGAPTADVVFLGHVGFESFGSLRSIAANVPFDHPVKAKLWRASSRNFGPDSAANLRLIDDYWQEMDDWIGTQEPRQILLKRDSGVSQAIHSNVRHSRSHELKPPLQTVVDGNRFCSQRAARGLRRRRLASNRD